MLSDAFRAAVEAEDHEALTEALADDIVFRSPAVFKPYEGKPVVSAILVEGAAKVFEDFRYTDQIESEGVAKYMWPESVEVFDEFPRTPSLKVVKRDVVRDILTRIVVEA